MISLLRLFTMVCIILTEAAVGQTAPAPQLVKDILIGLNPYGSNQSGFTAIGNTVYFSALDVTHGQELWKSDGTAAGTGLVKDIYAGINSGSPTNITAVGSTLFFSANDGSSGVELWMSDGTTAGTVRVKDIGPGINGSAPSQFSVVGSTLFFVANDGLTGSELWKSDGTSVGTVLVKDINPGLAFGFPANTTFTYFTPVGNTLYFVAQDSVYGTEVWKSDGTAAGTMVVRDLRAGGFSSNPQGLTAVGNTVFFSAIPSGSQRQLWKTDGTVAGTVLVKNIAPTFLKAVGITLYFSTSQSIWKSDGTDSGTTIVKALRTDLQSASIAELTALGSTLYFTADDGVNGTELWKSDGTTEGTVMVKNIAPTLVPSTPSSLAVLGSTLYFSANDVGVGQRELWKSDGTTAGTVQVKDIYPGNSSNPINLTVAGSTIFFTATNGINGAELWKSDGTAGGTAQVRDINGGTVSSVPLSFTSMGGALYFTATNPSGNGAALWKSDGTTAGTVLVKDIHANTGANPTLLTAVGNTLYFSSNDFVHGAELWKSDGTEAGTVMVKDIYPGSQGGPANSSSPSEFKVVENTLYFKANNGTNGSELWKTDGTEAGTVLVKDVRPGEDFGNPIYLTAVGSSLYFGAYHGSTLTELWKSDGTEAGTVLVKGDRLNGGLVNIMACGDTLYFTLGDSATGVELWKTDGTEGGTAIVKDIRPGIGSSSPYKLTAVGGGILYFVANNGTNGFELWKTDGTEVGTIMLKDIRPGLSSISPDKFTVVGDLLYFIADNGTNGFELWKTDGTEAGTVMMKDIVVGTGTSSPTHLTAVGDMLYFAASDVTASRELWKSDGTELGTVRVKDIKPGTATSGLGNFMVVGSTLFFTADDGVNGNELWKSDGTEMGTVLVGDITGDSGSSSPANLFQIAGQLFFSATTEQTGQELFVLPIPIPTVAAISPNSGTFAGGTSVTITGTGFTDATAVSIGDAVSSFVVVNDSTITAVTAAGSAGPAIVRVVIPTGSSAPNTLFAYIGNAAPSDIALSSASVAESNDPVTIGTLSATDADAGQTHTFTFANGEGDTDNGYFIIANNALSIPYADYESKTTYSIRVRADDGFGGMFEKQFTIAITNIIEGPSNIVLAQTGGVIPAAGTSGIPSGATWSGFGIPAISNGSGLVAYIGSWKVGFATIKGIFINADLIVKTGDPAPRLPGVTIKTMLDPLIEEGGSTAFLATLKGTGVTAANDGVIMRYSYGVLEILAREGDIAADTGGAVWKSFKNISDGGYGTDIAFNATLLIGSGAPAVTAANDSGAWVISDEMLVTKIVQEGVSVIGLPVGETIKSYRFLVPSPGTMGHGNGYLTGEVSFPAVTSAGRKVLLGQYPPQVMSQAGDTLESGESFASFGLDIGGYMLAKFKTGIGGVTPANATGIYASGFLVRTGAPAVGVVGATYTALKNPVFGESRLSFAGTIKGLGVNAANNDCIWSSTSNYPEFLSAREGDAAPGTGGGVWKAFKEVAAPGGSVLTIFTAMLRVGTAEVTAENDFGVWSVDYDGTINLLFREGDTIDGKTLRTSNVFTAVAGSQGARRSFNENNTLVWKAMFTDRTTAIIKTVTSVVGPQ